jgi:hypothetical protein
MNPINYQLLSASQLYAFVQAVLSNFNLETMPEGIVKSHLQMVAQLHAQFGLGFERNSKDPYALEEEQKDLLRDKYFNGMKNYVNSFLASDVAAEVLAAEQISAVIDKHGRNAASLSNAKETTALKLMLNELERDLMPQIETLQATKRVQLLKAAQADFEATVTLRYANKSEKEPTTTQFRKELIERFRKLLNALEVDFEATHNATIGGYIARIDELIADTMASAKGVKTRRDNEPGESEQPEPPTA